MQYSALLELPPTGKSKEKEGVKVVSHLILLLLLPDGGYSSFFTLMFWWQNSTLAKRGPPVFKRMGGKWRWRWRLGRRTCPCFGCC